MKALAKRKNGEKSETMGDLVPFKLHKGGKEPPKQGNNWLGELKTWTVFLARDKKVSVIDLFMFQKRDSFEHSTVLMMLISQEKPITRFVSTIDFSNQYELMDIVEEGHDGEGDRSNLAGGLEILTDIEHGDTVDGEARQ